MCFFSSSPPTPPVHPAPYSLQNSQTAVTETSKPADQFGSNDGMKATTMAGAPAPTTSKSGLNVQGM